MNVTNKNNHFYDCYKPNTHRSTLSIEKKYYLVMLIAILFISLCLFRKYIFGGYYFFNTGRMSDIIRANVPTYYQIYDSIKDGSTWSWKMATGTSIFSHYDALGDPFTYIVFLFGREHILDMLVWMFIIKLLCEGSTFYLYLLYMKIDPDISAIVSILYAYSGFSMIQGSNFHIGTILVYFPLVLLGADIYIKSNKQFVLWISLSLTAIQSLYFFYDAAIGLFIYALIRMKMLNKLSIRKCMGFIFVGILACATASFILLPTLYLMLTNNRVSNSTSKYSITELIIPSIKSLTTAISRSVNNFALGRYEAYSGNSYTGPDYFEMSTFSGSLTLFWIDTLLHNKTKKNKIILVLLLATVAILFPITGWIFNAGRTINARWEFILSLIFAMIAAIAMQSIRNSINDFNRGLILETFSITALSLLVGIFVNSIGNGFDNTVGLRIHDFLKSLFFIAFVSIISISFIKADKHIPLKYRQISLTLFAIVVLSLDICINYMYDYDSSESVSDYSEANNCSYIDSSSSIISEILPKNNEWYRINKSFDSVQDSYRIYSLNDSMVQGYYGLKQYNSMANSSYSNFLIDAGCYLAIEQNIPKYIDSGIKPNEVRGQELNYVNGVGERYLLMNYLGVKYYLSKEDHEEVTSNFHEILEYNNIHVYENDDALPLAFCNTRIVSQDTYLKLNDDEIDKILLTSTVIPSNVRNENTDVAFEDVEKSIKYNQKAFKLTLFDNEHIEGNITIPNEGQWLSTTIPYDKNWQIIIDGKQKDATCVNTGFIGCKINPGIHHIVFNYNNRELKFGIIISLISIIIELLCLQFEKNTKFKFQKVN